MIWRNTFVGLNPTVRTTNELLITGIVFIIVWLIAFSYINYKPTPMEPIELQNNNLPTYKLIKEVSETPRSFTMLNPAGGIVFPSNMPTNIFMDNMM